MNGDVIAGLAHAKRHGAMYGDAHVELNDHELLTPSSVIKWVVDNPRSPT